MVSISREDSSRGERIFKFSSSNPIRLETDRFFRCCKEISTPMQVYIGETLYNELEIKDKNKFEVIRRFVPKGINEEYTIYRFKDII